MFNPLQWAAIASQDVVGDTWTANNATLSEENDKLVAYWKAEDLTDEINSHTLTNVGTTTFTAGKRDNAFTLNGSSQYLSITDTDFVFGTGNFTISLWLKSIREGTWDTIIDIDGYASGILMRIVDNDSLYIAGTYYDWNPETYITDNVYAHVVLCRIGNTFRVYVDNVERVSGTKSVDLNLSGALLIGQASHSSMLYKGQFDEIGIWKGYGATSTFVSALYNTITGSFYK